MRENNKIETDSFLQSNKEIGHSNGNCNVKVLLMSICLVLIGAIIGALIVYFTNSKCAGVSENSLNQTCFVDDHCKAYLEILETSKIKVSFIYACCKLLNHKGLVTGGL